MVLTSFIAIESGLLEAESFSCSGRERIVIKTSFYWPIAGNEFSLAFDMRPNILNDMVKHGKRYQSNYQAL